MTLSSRTVQHVQIADRLAGVQRVGVARRAVAAAQEHAQRALHHDVDSRLRAVAGLEQRLVRLQRHLVQGRMFCSSFEQTLASIGELALQAPEQQSRCQQLHSASNIFGSVTAQG